MWDMKPKLLLRLCLFTFIYATMIECRLTSTRRRETEWKAQYVLPKDFMERSKSILGNVMIPNRDFCSEMILKPEDHYLVLPWWYNYCQDLREKNTKGYTGNVHFTAVHKYILDEVQAFKKRQKAKKQKLSQLQMELESI